MRQELIDILICPRCLPSERSLHLDAEAHDGVDIITGALHCRHCGTGYPIREGVASLLPDGDTLLPDPYSGGARLSAYLWGHYADLWQDPEAIPAYREWRRWLPSREDGVQLDVGCAVGRFTFEMADSGCLTLGIDRCSDFIRAARRLLIEGSISFSLRREGLQGEPQHLALPADWQERRCEFLVADAQALPFPAARFENLASLNLVDKLPSPRRHFAELSRVALNHGSSLLFADPFSWSTEVAPEEEWLGGQRRGPFQGPGYSGVEHLLVATSEPPWRLLRHERTPWKLRSHRNHYEQITSETMLFCR